MFFLRKWCWGTLLLSFWLLVRTEGPAQDVRQEKQVLRQDFRGQKVDPQLFELIGLHNHIHEEPEGLRIVLSGEEDRQPETGIVFRPTIKGDCEIIVSYDLLRADRPQKGRAVGVTLYIRTPSNDAVQLTHFYRSSSPDGLSFSCDRFLANAEGKRQSFGNRFPTEARSGKFRMKRQGAEVTCLVAADDQEMFRELFRFHLGTEDIVYARAAADTAKSADPVEVRIRDFEVRATEILNVPSRTDQTPTRLPARWPLRLAILGFLLLLLAGVVWSRWNKPTGHVAGLPAT